MSSTDEQKTRLVPAICTQCGGQLEVDPSQEAAVCKYCGTPFVVEKAINNYTVQHAKIDHVDTVNVDMKGAADSMFSFLGTQLSERRAERREEREASREERRKDRAAGREFQKLFLKGFGIVVLVMFAVFFVLSLVQMIRGDADETESSSSEVRAEEAAAFSYTEKGGFLLDAETEYSFQ